MSSLFAPYHCRSACRRRCPEPGPVVHIIDGRTSTVVLPEPRPREIIKVVVVNGGSVNITSPVRLDYNDMSFSGATCNNRTGFSITFVGVYNKYVISEVTGLWSLQP